MKEHKGSFDFMLSTVPESHDLNPFLPLLKRMLRWWWSARLPR